MNGEDPQPAPNADALAEASMAEATDRAAEEIKPPSAPSMLRIVGIGASAGGLQAFEKFFSHLPLQSGLAFVVIQHLAPRHTSILRDLIARATQMPVLDAQDGVAAEADHVYVITPGTQLKIAGGVFALAAEIGHSSIDTFFRSLAEDRGANAVGIVLSGSGTDGTKGLLAIKEHGGLTMTQRPETAAHDSMPRSAIDAGVVDHVLLIEEMPGKLLDPGIGLTSEGMVAVSVEQVAARLPNVCEVLARATGHDFSRYKKGTLSRRTLRRILQLRLSSVDAYLERLATDPAEAPVLLNEILIGVTQFFRVPETFEYLGKSVIPRIIAGKKAGQGVRIWVPGCASGEEAYSIAILLHEQLAGMRSAPFVQIFATDIDEGSVAEARRGRYPRDISKDVSSERLTRFFVNEGETYRVVPQVREMCVFSPHDLLHDPPFFGLDLISCRNVFIYMEADLQQKLVPIFHYALNPGGYLLLGGSESLSGPPNLFEIVDKGCHVYQRLETVKRPTMEFPHPKSVVARPALPRIVKPPLAPDQMMGAGFERLMLQEYTSPGALVNASGEVLYFAGPTGRYLQPPVGPPGGNILDVAHASLRIELRAALHEAVTTGKRVVRDNVLLNLDDVTQHLRLIVRPQPGLGHQSTLYVIVLQERPALVGEPVEATQAAQPLIVEALESELRATRSDLTNTVQQLESSNEQLTSSNEELKSANEELQSSNEELQTSQEELKSVNEELETVNAELQRKVDELGHAHDDLQNFFSSSEVATLFVDPGLRVARFTPAAGRVFHLIESDIGRPLDDFAPRFAGVDLAANLNEVMRSLSPVERQIEALDKSAWFLLRMLPYRTRDNTIGGAILTLTDITRLKSTEAELRRLATVVKDSNDAVTVQDLEGNILAWNHGAERMYGYSEDEAVRMNISTIVPEEGRSESLGFLERIKRGEGFITREVKRRTKDGRLLDVWVVASKLVDDQGQPVAAATTERDMTSRKQTEAEREQLLANLSDTQKQLRIDLDNTNSLLKVGMTFFQKGNIQPVLVEIVDAAIAISGADFGNIQLLDRDSGDLKIAAQKGFPDWWLEFWNAVQKGQGVCGTALEHRERVIVENVETDPLFAGTPALDVQLKAGVRAVQSTPLIGRAGELLGMLSTHYRTTGRPSDRGLQLVDLLARQAADILKMGVAERTAEEANEHLREADRRKDEFLSVLSHELRNPLAPITNSLFILDNAVPNSEQYRQARETIGRQVDYLARLIEDLLDVTRISSGKIQLQLEPLDLYQLVRRTVQDHRSLFAETKVELELLPGGEGWVNGDQTRLAQVIGNLLQNAAKFTPPQGKTIVSVEVDVAQRQAIVRVQDTGVGIKPEMLPHIFEAFAQGESMVDRTKGGLGLGLALVKRLVELHAGSVRGESSGSGKGSTFTIRLPLSAATVSTAAPAPRPKAGRISKKVLIIEDNIDAADSLRTAIEIAHHIVDVAYSGTEGIEKARTFKPDVVLCDLGLPGITGLDVARELRADPNLSRVSLIALSGYAQPQNVAEAKAAGFDTHLGKPFDVEALLQLIESSSSIA
jgi:two-component system CheB/CheR fusion protein